VVAVWLLDVQQHARGTDVERAVRRDRILGDHRVAVVVGVVQPRRCSIGRECDAEQTALAVGAGLVGQVGDLADLRLAIGVGADPEHRAVLTNDEQRGVTGPDREPDR
jgi:hypothetical protein